MFQPGSGLVAPQWIEAASQVTGIVITEFVAPTLGIRCTDELAFFVPIEKPGLIERIGELDNLKLTIPFARTDPAKAVGDTGSSRLQVIVEAIEVAILCPMLDNPPLQVVYAGPLVKTA